MPSLPDYESGNDLATETDAEFLARLDYEAAKEKARLDAFYPAYEPTAADLAEMAAWSQAVDDHDDALQTWLGFFGHDEERSTFYIS